MWQWTIVLLLMFSGCNPIIFPIYANSVSPHRCRMEAGIEEYIMEHNVSFAEVACRIGPWSVYENKTVNVHERGCSRFKVNWTEFDLDQLFEGNSRILQIAHELEQCPFGYVHEESDQHYPGNVVKGFETVCEKSSLYLLGMSIAFMIGGWCAGKFGRRRTLIVAFFFEAIAAVWVSLSPNYISYVLARMFLAMSNVSRLSVASVYMIEMTVARYRSMYSSFLSFGLYSMYNGLTALWAYLIPNWRLLHVVMMTPGLLSLSYICYLPESPRWLVSQDRYADALKTLKRGYRINNPRKSRDGEGELEEIFGNFVRPDELVTRSVRTVNEGNVGSRTGAGRCLLKLTILAILVHFFTGLCNFGFLFYATAVKYYIYLVGVMNALTAIPANLLFALVYRYVRSRKRPLQALILLSGVTLLTSSLYTVIGRPTTDVAITVGTNIALVLMGAVKSMLCVYIPELFPSDIRTQRTGLALSISRIGVMLCTFINEMDYYLGHGVPLIIYTAILALLFICFLFMPDTTGENLPDF
ncbi:unnamed protein product [Calicophoron daubneyi]|uniref:Major facilitator superfamily (MFS) profile domain-containing protein n=1 Tax=Calicophoron daubneyi TaxID=300641 RepID=A0AAV2TQP7_CALDB